MVKVSLIALFVSIMTTLTIAASAMPVPAQVDELRAVAELS